MPLCVGMESFAIQSRLEQKPESAAMDLCEEKDRSSGLASEKYVFLVDHTLPRLLDIFVWGKNYFVQKTER